MDTTMILQSLDRKLPPEVWEHVISNPNHVDSYHLAIKNKFMWKLVRHLPIEAKYNINTKKFKLYVLINVGSFNFLGKHNGLIYKCHILCL